MNAPIEYLLNKASAAEIEEHLSRCDADFVPPLSDRVEISGYARKIASKAIRFEAWSGGALVGLAAAYCNDQTRTAYVTSVSVLRAWTGKGIAACLVDQCIERAKALGLLQISLEVASDNAFAIRLYQKSGFIAGKAATTPFIGMNLFLSGGE